MLAIIDNYDSFTYNLVQYFGELKQYPVVFRNDEISVAELAAENPEYLVISPGPCTPNEAGISVAAIQHFAGKLPIFGICLGHQSIAQAFGGEIVAAKQLMHGKVSLIKHDGNDLFKNLPNPLQATRYHSLAVAENSLPKELIVTATTGDGEIMALRHREEMVFGVQFHPESIETVGGHEMLNNFLQMRPGRHAA